MQLISTGEDQIRFDSVSNPFVPPRARDPAPFQLAFPSISRSIQRRSQLTFPAGVELRGEERSESESTK